MLLTTWSTVKAIFKISSCKINSTSKTEPKTRRSVYTRIALRWSTAITEQGLITTLWRRCTVGHCILVSLHCWVIVLWCHCIVSLHCGTALGCHCIAVSLHCDVTALGCHCIAVSLHCGVTALGCHCIGVSLHWGVTALRCHCIAVSLHCGVTIKLNT